MARRVRIKEVFDLTGGTVLVIEPLDGVIVAGDVIEIPTREGGTRATPILGVEFLDRRLSSGEPESSLALVVAHLPAAALQAPVDAEVSDRSVVALSGFELAILNRACRAGGQDRAAAWPREPGLIVALAEGAGGVGGGASAAQAIVDAAQAWTPLGKTADDLIRDLDRGLSSTTGGQSTAVILSLLATGIVGASVGDSGAWIVREGSAEDVTGAQCRKPLVGSGGCAPVAFTAGPLRGGTLLVASDGLLKYAKPSDITRVAGQGDLRSAASELVGLVTLRSGEVPDDVAVVLCREVAATRESDRSDREPR
jgi:serine/threonine protein phosphatase PrpC